MDIPSKKGGISSFLLIDDEYNFDAERTRRMNMYIADFRENALHAFKRHDEKRELKLLKAEHVELQQRFDQLECHVNALMEAITLPDNV